MEHTKGGVFAAKAFEHTRKAKGVPLHLLPSRSARLPGWRSPQPVAHAKPPRKSLGIWKALDSRRQGTVLAKGRQLKNLHRLEIAAAVGRDGEQRFGRRSRRAPILRQYREQMHFVGGGRQRKQWTKSGVSMPDLWLPAVVPHELRRIALEDVLRRAERQDLRRTEDSDESVKGGVNDDQR